MTPGKKLPFEPLWITIELPDGRQWRCPFSQELVGVGTDNEAVVPVLRTITDLMSEWFSCPADGPDRWRLKVCSCHGEPLERDASTNGGWRCAVRRREKQLRYWHKQNGGYVKRRRRQLAAQRCQVLERLEQLTGRANA